jgi:hypothetical protein
MQTAPRSSPCASSLSLLSLSVSSPSGCIKAEKDGTCVGVRPGEVSEASGDRGSTLRELSLSRSMGVGFCIFQHVLDAIGATLVHHGRLARSYDDRVLLTETRPRQRLNLGETIDAAPRCAGKQLCIESEDHMYAKTGDFSMNNKTSRVHTLPKQEIACTSQDTYARHIHASIHGTQTKYPELQEQSESRYTCSAKHCR